MDSVVMSVQCASHHLRCDSSRRVASAARGVLGGRALISEPHEGWVSIWDEEGCDENFEGLAQVASRLSERLGAPCMSFFVGEDGATRYWLHDSGRLVDAYVSRGPAGGDAPALVGYCLGGTDPEDLRDILEAETSYEPERVEALAEMLGIEPERASLCYAAIAERENPRHEAPPEDEEDSEDAVEDEHRSSEAPAPLPPLHAAARVPDPAALRLLLGEGADPNGRDGRGRTALHHCAESLALELESLDAVGRGEWWRRNAEARSEAIEREEEPARAWERERRTMLPSDHYEGGLHAAEALLEAGAEADARDAKGERPLAAAAREGHLPLLELLLKSGAQASASDLEQSTALHAAAEWGFDEIVTTLLRFSAEPDQADACGWTPLMLAAEAGYSETVARLLEAGADPRRTNGAGRSVSGLALDAGRKALAARLREL